MSREKLIVNDVHLGAIRASGTTISSAKAIREYLQYQLRTLLFEHTDKDIIVNGDLFDTFNVFMQDVLEFYMTAVAWLKLSDLPVDALLAPPKLVLGRGNHDISKDSSKMSSFDFVARLLQAQFPERVQVVTEPAMIFSGIYMIPHMPNQDQFDLALSRIPEGSAIVLLHANYDNHFAVEADHSLNMSEKQVGEVLERLSLQPTFVFGHEHQARVELGGKVFVTGNQWPSSVADCLNNPDGLKFAHLLRPEQGDWGIDPLQTWSTDIAFREVPWGELADAGEFDFIRVVGEATAEESPDVIKAIANFRKGSDALVVTNAVKVDGVSDMQELTVSMEEVRSFDVLAYLLENLDADQGAVVKELINGDTQLKEAA